MKHNYIDKVIIVLIVLLFAFALFLQLATMNSTKNLENEEIVKTRQYIERIATLIEKKIQTPIHESLEKDFALRKKLNEIMHAFLTTQYSYIFLLYKDESGHYRFLLDGATKESEEFKSPFFPQSKLFDKAYDDKKMQIVEQKDGVEEVWLSFVYPIVKDEKTGALLVLDLSKEYAKRLKEFNSPLMNVIHFMQWFLAGSLVLLLFLAYRYYVYRKHLIKDSLTGAYSKYYLNELFSKQKTGRYNAVLLDIDNFKNINEKYGVSVGDLLIKNLVEKMTAMLPKGTKIIRTGGTEFFMLLKKESVDDFSSFMHTFFKTLKNSSFQFSQEKITMGFSVSAMVVPLEIEKVENVLQTLDKQILEIKKSGKNRVEVLKDIGFSDVRYTNLDYIKEALDDGRFTCIYQPIYNMQTNKIDKFEALVRMQDSHKSEKLILPRYFLQSVRCTSQYIRMSKLVLLEVFNTLQKNPNIKLSMNLDLDDLDNDEMMQMIQIYLKQYQELAHRLTFEIVEENEIRDFEKVNTIFTHLKLYGSKIAIDDFGSGYANYIYLTRLKVDILKLDAVLIKNLKIEPKRAKLVIESLKDLADKLELEVVAEYVYDEETYAMLKEIGIVYMQGNYLGEPKRLESYTTN